MSAALNTQPAPRVAALLEAHDGNADAALLACLAAIDRLAADLAKVRYQTSRRYSYGSTRRTTRPASPTTTAMQEPLDV